MVKEKSAWVCSSLGGRKMGLVVNVAVGLVTDGDTSQRICSPSVNCGSQAGDSSSWQVDKRDTSVSLSSDVLVDKRARG